MTLLRRNSPFGEMLSLRQAMDRLFEDSFIRPGALGEAQSPLPLDVYSNEDSIVIEAALPGVRPEDVDISILGDTLTISGRSSDERKSEESGYSYREIRRGAFSRSVTLPGGLNADAAAASFEHGLLRLAIPKAEEAKPRQIRINPTSNGRTISASSQQGPADAGQAAQDGSQDGSRGA
ncbi:MAG TPA: Hsp20/alpha crystallin family protein [Candidatus Limnocylindrales bacterium]|nr:Hsp20/alpha crystallin family protein [Candidatus Limnocylindrales bacterium]